MSLEKTPYGSDGLVGQGEGIGDWGLEMEMMGRGRGWLGRTGVRSPLY